MSARSVSQKLKVFYVKHLFEFENLDLRGVVLDSSELKAKQYALMNSQCVKPSIESDALYHVKSCSEPRANVKITTDSDQNLDGEHKNVDFESNEQFDRPLLLSRVEFETSWQEFSVLTLDEKSRATQLLGFYPSFFLRYGTCVFLSPLYSRDRKLS